MERKFMLCYEAAKFRDGIKDLYSGRIHDDSLASNVEDWLLTKKGCGSDEATEITQIVVGCNSTGDRLK